MCFFNYPELDKYLNVYFLVKTKEWNVVDSETGKPFDNKIRFEARQCTIEDFRGQKELFDNWSGWSLICPESYNG